jgi:hypothetical protein
VSDKTPFQGGTDTTSTIYQDALAMVIATDATVWFKSLNGTMPEYLGDGWSFDQGGNLCYNDIIVIRNVKDLVGEKNNGELFYFSKDATTPTGYAAAYVEDGYYKVTMPSTFTDTAISSISIASKEITGFTFANGVLKVPVSAISSLSNGEQKMIIIAGINAYQTTVTVANHVLCNPDDVRNVLTNNSYIDSNSKLIVLDGDITWSGATYTGVSGTHMYGTLDGKGYAIKNFKVNPYLWQTMQKGAVVKNIAFLDVTYAAETGLLAQLTASGIVIDNVAATYYAGASRGFVGSPQGNLTINNAIVVCNSNSNALFGGSYKAGITLTMSNTYCIGEKGAVRSDLGEADTTNVYETAQTAVCANIGEILTKSDNLKNFDSKYWSLKNGSIYFGDEVVVAAAVAE